MGHGLGVAHDPSVAVGRRHLPALARREEQGWPLAEMCEYDSVFAAVDPGRADGAAGMCTVIWRETHRFRIGMRPTCS